MSHPTSTPRQKIFLLIFVALAAIAIAVLFAFINNKQIASQSKTSVINGVGISPEPFRRAGITPMPFRKISPEPFRIRNR